MNAPVLVWTAFVFVIGACSGSLLNVCIARLPLEKSILWPGSRCGTCLQPIRWYDNIPLVSYWLRRGRCRNCGARFSVRYFLIELLTAVLFAGIFHLEIIRNIHDHPFFTQHRGQIMAGIISWQAWAYFLHHALLLSFLIVAAVCDLQTREIPLSLTMWGAGFGLIGAVLYPWPWPSDPNAPGFLPPPNLTNNAWWLVDPQDGIFGGLYPWPVWGPLPNWMPLGGHLSGLATGLAGILVGTGMLRGVRFLFTRGLGREALGLGDADLMMMVGAFLGWQPVVVAFFVGAFVTLGFAIVQAVVFRDNSLPFGPGLAAGSIVTMLCWDSIRPAVQPVLFNEQLLILLIAVGGAFMLFSSFIIGRFRGRSDEDAKPG